jgi:hypothetical protein
MYNKTYIFAGIKLLLIIIFFLVVSCAPPPETPDLFYSLINSGTAYEVARGVSIETNIIIPAKHKGLPVTKIAENGFHDRLMLRAMMDDRPSMTSITIPNSITTIGSSAFADCTELISITIPNSVTTIESSAFIGCYNLTSIVIPNSVTHIGRYTFYNCTNLRSVYIPKSVTHIGENAFSQIRRGGDPYSFPRDSLLRLTIYAEAPSQPETWNEKWNTDNNRVVWSATMP